MRIAFIVGGFPQISETFILYQITGLIELGHKIDIYSRINPNEPYAHPEVQRYELLKTTRYFDLPGSRSARLLRAMRTFCKGAVKFPAAMVQCLNITKYRSVYALLNNIMFAFPFLGQHYDSVFCHFGGNGIDFIVLKAIFPRTPFITMFHGDDLSIGDEQGPGAFAVLRELGDAFLVTTNCYGRATLRRYDFQDRKIITHRLGVQVKNIPFRKRELTTNVVHILSVGRLVSKKGFEFAIRAIGALQAANNKLHIEYVIVGEGPLRLKLQALIKDLGVQATVRLVGALPRPDVLQWMSDSDIYLLPSLMEQAGVVLLEAQATGLPIVATRVGGVAEMVCEGRSAMLVPPGSSTAIAELFKICSINRGTGRLWGLQAGFM